jgi:hypothetical protein
MESWEIGSAVEDQKNLLVFNVVAFENKLYVLDTRSPLFGAVLDTAFVFNLNDNNLEKTYTLQKAVIILILTSTIYVSIKKTKNYCTDSGRAGLIVLDMTSGKSTRVLDNHFSTKAESYLTFDNKKWENTINSDGIALDTKKMTYSTFTTGYSLYSTHKSIG